MYKIIALLLFLFSSTALADSSLGIQALFASPLTDIFMAIIIGAIIYFAVYKFDRLSITQGPEVLTTMGIFGSFCGISWALLHFNSSDLTSSITILLDGIKTAFCASVLGVLGALVIKARHIFGKNPVPQASNTPKAASIDDLVMSIMALKNGLVGTEEGTLLSQMKLMRQENLDQLKELNKSFNEFSKHMVENNQKALIEALNQVMIDFNKNLTEQFGENFKQLNEAVKLLVTWQQQYKDELEIIKQSQQQASKDLNIASEAFKDIVERTKEFSSIAEKLKSMLELMNDQTGTIYQQEKALSDLLAQMKDITPEFAVKLARMIDEITNGVNSIQAKTADIIKDFGAQSKQINSETKTIMIDALQKSQQQLSEGLLENSKIIKDGVTRLDKELQEALNDSLSSLGKQLASLSEKFVEDYSPLTDKLREVVRIAARN